jgi:hypothetical protein
METKNCTNVVLFCIQNFFIVCAAKECQNNTVSTQRWFYYVWYVSPFLFVIEVGQVLSGYVLMLC